MKSSWCNSSPVKAVAGRPAASVAIRRVTGGCEAYTVSKQVAMIQPRNRSNCDADVVLSAEGSIRHTGMRGVVGIAGVASTGHAYQGTFREPRRASCFSAIWARWRPTQRHLVSGGRGLPREKRTTLKRSLLWPRETGGAGKGRRAVLRFHSTDEGGEPQGSRKGRPRYPLEGSRSDASCSSCGCKSRRWRVPRCHRSYTRQHEG
jgi:hypothetical protein